MFLHDHKAHSGEWAGPGAIIQHQGYQVSNRWDNNNNNINSNINIHGNIIDNDNVNKCDVEEMTAL